MRILVVEDEESIRKVIKLNLEMEGHIVEATDNGRKALELASKQHFDLLVLDIMLPEINGLDVCRQIRLQNDKVAIIIVSAKDNPSDRIKGLKYGADDYLVKPFNLEELLLRVEKLLERSSTKVSPEFDVYHFGTNTLYFSQQRAITHDNKEVNLTKKEVMLLKLLVENRNNVVSRNEILQYVWGYDIYPSTRTIDNFILVFRKYFEVTPNKPQYFQSVRGIGYKFTD